MCSPSKTEEDLGSLQAPANKGTHDDSGREPLGQTRGPCASQRRDGSILSHGERMPRQRDHIVSSMAIHSDEQLPIKEGNADLEYYYDSASIILSAGYDECAVDRPRRHQKAPW
jgi:hypothetical protein